MHFRLLVVFLMINSALAGKKRLSVGDKNQKPTPAPQKTSQNNTIYLNFYKPRHPEYSFDNKQIPPQTTPAPPITGTYYVDPNAIIIPPKPTPAPPITSNGVNGTNTTSSELTQGATSSTSSTSIEGIYIWIAIAVAVLLIISQSICFYLYIRKLKSSQPPRNIPLIAAAANSEDRYQRAPTRTIANTLRPAEDNHSSSLYEYECIKPMGKPEPPPTSTLPKRNRPPLPLPNNIQGPKSSTLTTHSTQELLQQRGRQVSTVPSKPPINFNALSSLSSRSPQQRRLPTPVRTPVLKPRGTRDDRASRAIYESLPDLREFRQQAKPTNVQPLVVVNPPSATTTPNLNRKRGLPAHHSYRNVHTPSPSPVMPPKPRKPLPQEHNRNAYPTKPKEIIKDEMACSIYESLPDLRELKHHQKPPIAPPPVLAPAHPPSSSLNKPRTPGPEAISSELMQKLKRRAELTSLGTSQNTGSSALPRKPPVMPPRDVTPIPKYADDSSDDEEWRIEELKDMHMYNI